MDESFQDSLQIPELYKPSILKLEEILMPYPTNFGNKFDEVKHPVNDIPSFTNQVNNFNFNQSSQIFKNNAPLNKYNVAFSQCDDNSTNINMIDSNENINDENSHRTYKENVHIQQQEQLYGDKNKMTFDDFVKIFGPAVSNSFENLSPELHQSLLAEMYNQSQHPL